MLVQVRCLHFLIFKLQIKSLQLFLKNVFNCLFSGLREVVYPVRIGSRGNTHSTHFISKRSTRYVQNFDSSVQYVLSGFGRNFSLDLTFSKDFIAPTLVVQHFSGNSTWRNESHKSVGLSQCFYSGRINQDLNSRGVFSLCEGLVSTMESNNFNCLYK